MSYKIEVHRSQGIIEVKNSGSFSPEEMKIQRDEIISLKNETNINKVLFDNTELNQLPPPDVVAEFVKTIDPNIRHAGFINPGQASMDLMFLEIGAQNHNKEIKLFTSREEALHWLISDDV